MSMLQQNAHCTCVRVRSCFIDCFVFCVLYDCVFCVLDKCFVFCKHYLRFGVLPTLSLFCVLCTLLLFSILFI